jgi:hypothetical protein
MRRPAVIRHATALAVAALAATASLVTPSQAASGLGPIKQIRACSGSSRAAATADGTVWASTNCGVEGSITPDILRPGAAAWTRRADRALGGVFAVADDGRFTYTVRTYQHTNLDLNKMQHDAGWFGSAGLSRATSSYHPTVVGRDGRYWAVWSERTCDSTGTDCRQRLFQMRSINGGNEPQKVAILADPSGSEDEPALALRGAGVVLAFTRTVGSERTLHVATAGLDGSWSESEVPLATGADASQPDLTVSGDRTVLAWSRGGRPVLTIDDGQLHFTTRRDVPYRAPVTAVAVAASGGRAFVATSATFPYAGGTTSRVYLASTGVTGLVSSTEVSAVATPTARWELEDLVAARGKATVLMDTGSALVSRSQT